MRPRAADRLSELGLSSLEKIGVTANLDALGSWPSGGVGIVDESTVGIFSMATVPEHRRRGLGRSVLSTLLGEAVVRDANLAWLQVTPSNEPALPNVRFRAGARVPLPSSAVGGIVISVVPSLDTPLRLFGPARRMRDSVE